MERKEKNFHEMRENVTNPVFKSRDKRDCQILHLLLPNTLVTAFGSFLFRFYISFCACIFLLENPIDLANRMPKSRLVY